MAFGFGFCLLPFAFCLLPFAFCLLPFAFCLLPFAFCLLPFAFCPLPLAACCRLLPRFAPCLLRPFALCPLPLAAFCRLLLFAFCGVFALFFLSLFGSCSFPLHFGSPEAQGYGRLAQISSLLNITENRLNIYPSEGTSKNFATCRSSLPSAAPQRKLRCHPNLAISAQPSKVDRIRTLSGHKPSPCFPRCLAAFGSSTVSSSTMETPLPSQLGHFRTTVQGGSNSDIVWPQTFALFPTVSSSLWELYGEQLHNGDTVAIPT